ncbi:MAG: lipopolysaccharide kinase InaA family protein [Planctomycetes bacterium]|nr:lipopolysaccharide kinase InaA family protein [Planctomycetota bacterium]
MTTPETLGAASLHALSRKAPLRSPPATESIYRVARARHVGYADRSLPRSFLLRLVDYPELPLRANTRDTIKAGRTALLLRIELPVGGRMTSVAYKRVRRRSWLKKLTSLVMPNRVARSFRLARTLSEAGVATARPLAAVMPRWYRPFAPSYLAVEWLEGAVNLHVYLRRMRGLAGRELHRTSAAAAESLGRLLGRMHAAGVSHRDLKPGNLLVRAAGGAVQTWVIDLDGARVQRRISSRACWRNLARLALGTLSAGRVGRTMSLRFLRAWLHASGRSASQWKESWRGVECFARAMAAQKARRSLKGRS